MWYQGLYFEPQIEVLFMFNTTRSSGDGGGLYTELCKMRKVQPKQLAFPRWNSDILHDLTKPILFLTFLTLRKLRCKFKHKGLYDWSTPFQSCFQNKLLTRQLANTQVSLFTTDGTKHCHSSRVAWSASLPQWKHSRSIKWCFKMQNWTNGRILVQDTFNNAHHLQRPYIVPLTFCKTSSNLRQPGVQDVQAIWCRPVQSPLFCHL